MSSAVQQMKPTKTWKNITDNKLIHHKPPTKHVESHHENKQEIGELANLGKVVVQAKIKSRKYLLSIKSNPRL